MTAARIQLPVHMPRSYQVGMYRWQDNGGKRGVMVAHRRWGKDDVALGITSKEAMRRPANYWHMLPEYNQGRKAIWSAINPHSGMRRIDEAFPHEIRAATREHVMEVEFKPPPKHKTGSLWQVVGSDNYNSLMGAPPLGLVMSEFALADPQALAYLLPILEENGGWLWLIYTPRGRNHGYQVYEMARNDPAWFCDRQTAHETGVFTADQLERIKAEYIATFGHDDGSAKFEQEYECSFDAAIVGSYYAREIAAAERDGRITRVPYNPGLPVWTAWDLGYGDSTAIWFVQLPPGGAVSVIDYYEANGQTMAHYANVLLRDKPYVYEKQGHIFPHDAKKHSYTTGSERVVQLSELGVDGRVLAQTAIDDGVQAARKLLAKCYFDERKCARGLEVLRNYQREWDDDNKVFEQKPLHNWASHGADAFRYLAMGLPERVGVQPDKPVRGINDMTFNELLARQPKRNERV